MLINTDVVVRFAKCLVFKEQVSHHQQQWFNCRLQQFDDRVFLADAYLSAVTQDRQMLLQDKIEGSLWK